MWEVFSSIILNEFLKIIDAIVNIINTIRAFDIAVKRYSGKFTLSYRKLFFFCCFVLFKVSKGAKSRNRYNQVPHLTQDTNGKVTNSQLDTTNESQEVSPFPAGDHKAHINRCAQTHSKHKTENKSTASTA